MKLSLKNVQCSRVFIFKCSSSQDAVNLQEDLENVISWSTANNMVLHQDKFEVLNYSSTLNHTNTSLFEVLPFNNYARYYKTADDHQLKSQDQVKDLGIYLATQLSFSSHINHIVDKACSKAAWALSIFQCRRKDTMLTLYKSMVRPLLEYCCPLWHPNTILDIQSIENVQQAFTSKIQEIKDLRYWDRLKYLNLMSLQRRRERYCIIYMRKIFYCKVPNDINVEWRFNPRLGFKATLPKMPINKKISTAYESSFSVNGPRLWNTLPKDINCEPDFNTFKILLDRFLLSFPDEPPTHGYTSRNHNSIIDWCRHKF